MLSNLMTAKRRELNPTSHANANIANDRRLFQPPGFHIDVLMSVFTPASAIFAAFDHVPIDQPMKFRHSFVDRMTSVSVAEMFSHSVQRQVRVQVVKFSRKLAALIRAVNGRRKVLNIGGRGGGQGSEYWEAV